MTIPNNRYIAEKTLKAIEDAMNADQGSSFRYYSGQLIPTLKDAYEPNNPPFRSHLGASVIGRKCDREIWYGFRWYVVPKFSGRMLRLFNRGHLEEGRFIAALLTTGCQVYQYDNEGKQYRISDCLGHFGGSTDGVAFNIPDYINNWCLAEFKTHGEKSYVKLVDAGVREAKFEHYVQMQVYMFKLGLQVGLYLAVNKNTDEIYGELITLNEPIARLYIDRANTIINSKTPPKKLSENSSWYECKMCDKLGVCHNNEPPAFNCRTCKYSEPVADGKWVCTNGGQNYPLTKEQQYNGCQLWTQI